MKKTYLSPTTQYIMQPALRLMDGSGTLTEEQKRLIINTTKKLYGNLD